MDGDGGEVDVGEHDGARVALERCEGLEVVEDVFGEVGGDGGRVLVGHWGDEDGASEEELKVDREGGCILGVLVPQRLDDGCAVNGGLVESSVDVINEAISAKEGVEQGLVGIHERTYLISRTFFAASATVCQR